VQPRTVFVGDGASAFEDVVLEFLHDAVGYVGGEADDDGLLGGCRGCYGG
jgi:hypothetical protein